MTSVKKTDLSTSISLVASKHMAGLAPEAVRSFVSDLEAELYPEFQALKGQLEQMRSGVLSAIKFAEDNDTRLEFAESGAEFGELAVPVNLLASLNQDVDSNDDIYQERRKEAPWIRLGYGMVSMEVLDVTTSDQRAIIFSPLEQPQEIGQNSLEGGDASRVINKNNVVLSFANRESAQKLISLINHCAESMPADTEAALVR